MSSKIIPFLISTILFITIVSCGQTQTTEQISFPGAWLGQEPPGMTPVKFAPELLKNTFFAVFSPDGKEFYCAKYDPDPEVEECSIAAMKWADGEWSDLEAAPFSSTWIDKDLCMSGDGNTVFFRSNRPLPGTDTPSKSSHLWSSARTKNGWSEAKVVEFSGDFTIPAGYPSLTNDGTLYFSTTSVSGFVDQWKLWDIHYSKMVDGSYRTPVNLGKQANSDYCEADMFIAPDGSYFIVSCYQNPENNGEQDLYISFRKADKTWTDLKNMEAPINSEYREICPQVSPDGKYLFFNRIPSEGLSEDGRGTYWMDAKIIDSLRKKVFSSGNDEQTSIDHMNKYFGQKPPGMTAEIFAPGIISRDTYELGSVFSPDYKEFIYCTPTDDRGYVLWMRRYENGKWGEPFEPAFSKGYKDVDPTYSPDGSYIFFANGSRPGGHGDMDIWYVERLGAGWSEAHNAGPEVNSPEGEVHAVMTATHALYFSSGRTGNKDIHRAEFIDGRFTNVVNLGPKVNCIELDSDSYVDPSESFLVFHSFREPTYGDSDFFISFRDAGGWSAPVNMGPEINDEKRVLCPALTPDGKYFFFTRRDSEKEGRGNIYWIDARIIEQIKSRVSK